MSQAGRKLAQEVQAAMQNPPYRDLFDFRPSAGPAPLLLILGKLAAIYEFEKLNKYQTAAMIPSLRYYRSGRIKRWYTRCWVSRMDESK
jgi:hypothetical protein